jgi:hypothetical protein
MPLNIIDPTQTSASALLSQILRGQFDEWRSTFKPIELSAINELSFNNPRVLTDAVSDAEGATTNAFKTLQGTLSRENASLGITPTQEQAASSGRMLSLSQAAATAGAKNTARKNVRAQDESILLGTSPGLKIGGLTQ